MSPYQSQVCLCVPYRYVIYYTKSVRVTDVLVLLFIPSFSLLLSIDRRGSVVDAYDTVELALKYSKNDHHAQVVGIDLSGDPKVSFCTE